MDTLKKYVDYVEKAGRNFTDIIFRGKLIISSEEFQELYYKDYSYLSLRRRLQKIRERILFLIEPYEKERISGVAGELEISGGYIDIVDITRKSIAAARGELKDIYCEINRFTEFDLTYIYKKLFENLELFDRSSNAENYNEEISDIKNYTLENLEAQTFYY